VITLLAGGTGAAKLVDGFARATHGPSLTLICNTGDDIELYGIHVSPDIDTLLYTLAGMNDWGRGWGIAGDSFSLLQALARFGYETWFQVGDRDFATHLHRTLELRKGRSLCEATDSLRRGFGIEPVVLPMSNDPVETRVVTPSGDLHFQEFFVKGGWREPVEAVYFRGAETARPAPGVIDAILSAEAVILCPSNPVTSLGPILAVPGIPDALRQTKGPVLAVSPIVGGAPVSGPAHKLMAARGWEISSLGVAKAFKDFLDIFVIDRRDRDLVPALSSLGMTVLVTETVMKSSEDRSRLADELLRFICSGQEP
jgi:LPPG:FO 2-phospho-L-lactate transferase